MSSSSQTLKGNLFHVIFFVVITYLVSDDLTQLECNEIENMHLSSFAVFAQLHLTYKLLIKLNRK